MDFLLFLRERMEVEALELAAGHIIWGLGDHIFLDTVVEATGDEVKSALRMITLQNLGDS